MIIKRRGLKLLASLYNYQDYKKVITFMVNKIILSVTMMYKN